jgi:putative OPT family oligopeptide transporter
MREFTPLAIILGIIVGIVFGAANAYIGLKVGMTVSASIPAAVISMGILRGLLKRGTLLENNIVQTVGSVGESLAAGMIFVIPALFIFAFYADDPATKDAMRPAFLEMAIWGALGGLLGVLFMIPLRKMLIVKEHEKLPYPEGTACAEVLESGDRGGAAARTVFAGLGVGALFELVRGLGFFREQAVQRLPVLRTDASLDTSPALLGVGYILGVRVAGFMLAGAVLGWFVIIPAIAFFGAGMTEPIFPAETPIADMTPDDLWNKYLRYIGAGAVVLGGLVSLFKSLGTVGGSLFHMFGGTGKVERTGRDLPTILLLLLLVGLAAAMWYLPDAGYLNPLFKHIPVIACVIGFGFFFVTVSSRLVGIVGSSSNPASGMTIATILGTALIIVAVAGQLGLDPVAQKIAIISVGALVCIAVCIAGDTSQDLKTGFLVKATPWKQQVGELIGVLTATAAIAGVIWLIADRYNFVQTPETPNAVLAPQANLMKLLVEGVVDQRLPWNLIFIGIACALIVELLGIPSLPFAVGLYLPLYLSTPIMVGGVLRWFVDRRRPAKSESQNPGILASSGLVAGHGVMGVALVGVAALIGWWWEDPRYEPPTFDEISQAWVYHDVTTQPAPATSPGEDVIPSGELVVPHHLFPWLAGRFDFLDPEYGLRTREYEAGSFTGEYAVNWYKLLPVAPFALMTLWLLVVAFRRLDDAPPAPATAPPPPPDEGVTPEPSARVAPTSTTPMTSAPRPTIQSAPDPQPPLGTAASPTPDPPAPPSDAVGPSRDRALDDGDPAGGERVADDERPPV